jgi:DNA-binding Lrp family transcriptional regulator
MAPQSISDLSRQLNIPTLKLWRRIQQLQRAKLVELVGVEKVGNLEKKFYRVTALKYDLPAQFFAPKLNDSNLKASFEKYSGIQNEMNMVLSKFESQIPSEGDPTNFAVYAYMQAFVEVFQRVSTQTSLDEMKQLLANYCVKISPA